MLRFLTAGESHGPAEVAILEGIPAGLKLSVSDIQPELEKRRGGTGRGGRGKIESDTVEILSGIRSRVTIGSPITLLIENRDFANWKDSMRIDCCRLPGAASNHPAGEIASHLVEIHNPRPGHADLAGALKYGFDDIRNVLERASARETVMRVAVGAICKKFLFAFGIKIFSRVIQIGKAQTNLEMKKAILAATIRKDTLGGIIEVVARNIPVGLGSYVQWDKKLDGIISQALISIPSVKAIEIGEGIANSAKFGSQVQDEIFSSEKKYFRKTNRAGGLEGGVTNGEDIVCRVFLKPLSTIGNPLNTVDIKTKNPTKAVCERSDICAVPRAGVIAESMLAYVLADAFLEKFGGDNMKDINDSFKSYLSNI